MTVRAYRYRFNIVNVPYEGILQFASLKIPNFDGLVIAATNNSLTVWTYGHRINIAGMSSEAILQPAGLEIPNLYDLVNTTTN